MTKFKKVRTLKDIKNDPRVDFISDERHGWSDDGIWIYLKYPFYNRDNGTTCVHEFTVADCVSNFNAFVVENKEHWSGL
jgi:hypothetical protein